MKINMMKFVTKVRKDARAVLVSVEVPQLNSSLVIVAVRRGEVPSKEWDECMPCGIMEYAGGSLFLASDVSATDWRILDYDLVVSADHAAVMVRSRIDAVRETIEQSCLAEGKKLLAKSGLVEHTHNT